MSFLRVTSSLVGVSLLTAVVALVPDPTEQRLAPGPPAPTTAASPPQPHPARSAAESAARPTTIVSSRRAGVRSRWVPPVAPQVVRPFVAPAVRWGPGHRGVDLRASPGTPVAAAYEGRVVFAGVVAGRPVVSVDHPGGLRTTYEPVSGAAAVGTWVRAGQVIGTVARPDHCPGGCLHWGARRGEVYVDPMGLLARREIRLLPLTGA